MQPGHTYGAPNEVLMGEVTDLCASTYALLTSYIGVYQGLAFCLIGGAGCGKGGWEGTSNSLIVIKKNGRGFPCLWCDLGSTPRAFGFYQKVYFRT